MKTGRSTAGTETSQLLLTASSESNEPADESSSPVNTPGRKHPHIRSQGPVSVSLYCTPRG